MRIRFLTAMPREAEALGIPCEIIGIRGEDLPEIAKDDIIVNVGYCGAYKIPVGTVVEPIVSIDAHTGKAEVLDAHFDCRKAACFTAAEFVTKPLSEKPAVYDMELARLATLPCAGLYCLKIVSDSLDESDCEAFRDDAAWETVRTMLKGVRLL